jgi:hypothetical protein
VTVNAGAGNDIVRVGAAGAPGAIANLNVALGEGNNSVIDQGAVITGNVVVSAGSGADVVGPWTSPVSKMLMMNLGNGTNAATVTGPVGGQLGAGADNLTLVGLQTYFLSALMGAGTDTLTFLSGSSIGSGFIDFGLGDDQYVRNGVFVGGGLSIVNL